MAKAKKKLLPKDFAELLKKGSLKRLKAVFDTCDVNARGGYSKRTALAFPECPEKLIRWLFENGADLAAADTYGETPLHSHTGSRKGHVGLLLELGADVNLGENLRGTPLHSAAGAYNATVAGLLIEHGARVNALNQEQRTPLEYALERCSNIDIENMAALADVLLGHGAEKTPAMKKYVTRIGTDFEFHRSNYNPEFLEGTTRGLERLYSLFDVPPVPRRAMHDGKSPIIARSERWQDRHQELWELLVPSSGPAKTVQGEVVRISGRINDEMMRNGGINWDGEYKKMADAFLKIVASGKPLVDDLLAETRALIAEIKRKHGDSRRLCELGVEWVAQNPKPLKLPTPDYNR